MTRSTLSPDQILQEAYDEANQALRVSGSYVTLAYSPTTLYKAADEIVNNSTTLQADDALTSPIAANEVWVYEFVLFVLGDAGADIKYAVSAPAGATVSYAMQGTRSADKVIDSTALATTADTALAARGADAAGAVNVLFAYVANGGTAGSVTLTWAQASAVAADTRIKAGSFMRRHRVA